MVDPNDFVIARKRKKYKFAKFANAENCYEFEEWQQRPVDVVELGAGTALFLVELARRNPNKQFAAIDVKADRLQKGAYAALEAHVQNIVFIRARADQISELFAPASVKTLWLTFSDPFPRRGSVRRRMTHAHYLKQYAEMIGVGDIFIKHDDADFFAWTLEQLVREKWHIEELYFDLHTPDSDSPEEYRIRTSYEERWLDEGRVTKLVRAKKVT